MPETIASRPLPRRPENGWLAWQATIGYISSQYSLDAMMTVQAYPDGEGNILWAGSSTWGQHAEQANGRASLPEALRDLWREVDRNHVIFDTKEALLKRPTNYSDQEWLDEETESILFRILQVSLAVYGSDWRCVLVYQPVERPEARCHVRLLALQNSVQAGGQGATLRDACHDLYRNAAHYFVAYSGKRLEDIV